MPAAGQRIKALDFTDEVQDIENTSYTTTSTSFSETGTGFTPCGVSFVAPTSGKEKIDFGAEMANSVAAAATEVTPIVREGDVVGSGTTVVAASSDNKIRFTAPANNSIGRQGATYLAEGLTPGAAYNATLASRVSGSTGTIDSRYVICSPGT